MKDGKWRVQLQVNGETMPLNPFVSQMITSIILGMISPLKGLPENIETITVTVEKLKE
ncbi:MAG: hypothetical protein ACXQTQ_04495 [Candidatus Hecatellaceae archaeon]